MKKIILTITVALSVIILANAQDYSTGIGLRGGFFNGITVKHFIGDNTALEGILSTRWSGFEITGLYEIHNQAFDVDRLNWYYGFGAHVGLYDGDKTYSSWGNEGETYTVIGVDGIIGMEYNFTEVPINISIDWKPTLNLIGFTGFWADGIALSIRYIF